MREFDLGQTDYHANRNQNFCLNDFFQVFKDLNNVNNAQIDNHPIVVQNDDVVGLVPITPEEVIHSIKNSKRLIRQLDVTI